MPKTKKTIKTSAKDKASAKEQVKTAGKKSSPKKQIVKKLKPLRYYEATGRRKTAVARVRLFTRGDREFIVNSKPYADYFSTHELQKIVAGALRKMKSLERFRVVVKVRGGGKVAQAEAARHGTARALIKFNSEYRKRLKKAGYLKRDPRMKERKKYGLKKARRAPQWSKR